MIKKFFSGQTLSIIATHLQDKGIHVVKSAGDVYGADLTLEKVTTDKLRDQAAWIQWKKKWKDKMLNERGQNVKEVLELNGLV